MNINQKEIGQRIAEIRKSSHLTLEEFSNKLNIGFSHLCKVEKGTRCVSLDLLIDISIKFSVSTDYILMGKKNNTDEIIAVIHSINNQLEIVENKVKQLDYKS
ncbi:MAG: helix-turn-helix transcriptional regulator [Oscillospiraceae bacterium]|nr:helix-turn-helix transcriptional regulator [Oscillospiraceae bacterium]MBR6657510.1 helix-turn-helix transcriptional regulator [Oscillospiraceae bacterium]